MCDRKVKIRNYSFVAILRIKYCILLRYIILKFLQCQATLRSLQEDDIRIVLSFTVCTDQTLLVE
jgi:hypothetical protein